MAWVKLDDAMPHHPKLMAAGPQAFALDVAGICYSNKHATDGFIATYALPAVFPGMPNAKKVAKKLVEVGRWHEVEGGWQIHDVDDYQPTAAQQKEVSKKRAEAGRKGGSKSKLPPEADGKQSAKQNASVPDNPDPTRPVPEDQTPAPAPPPHTNGSKRKPPKNHDHQQLFQALTKACGVDPSRVPRSEGAKYGKCAKELAEIGATPRDVLVKARRYREIWPAVSLTPTALVNQWGQVDAKPGRDNVPDDACRECGQQLDKHDGELCAILAKAG